MTAPVLATIAAMHSAALRARLYERLTWNRGPRRAPGLRAAKALR
jgi:hypothetical protein